MLAGDEDALAALYRRRQLSIYRFALQMSGSAALAEDVTQEVFMALEFPALLEQRMDVRLSQGDRSHTGS